MKSAVLFILGVILISILLSKVAKYFLAKMENKKIYNGLVFGFSLAVILFLCSVLAILMFRKEAEIKMMLMEKEFQMNMQLKDADLNVIKDKEKFKEDRKDERTKIQASQQSELIDQRKNNKPPKKFESAVFDNLGGFGLEQFEPK